MNFFINPVLTEKSDLLRSQYNQYVFRLKGAANKVDIVRYLEEHCKVKIKSCRVANVRKKIKNSRTHYGKNVTARSGYKKIIVTLKEGEFNFYEGV